MNRRKLLGAGIVSTGLAITGCNQAQPDQVSAPAVQRKKRRLNMVTTWPKNLPGTDISARRTAARIEELSEGSIEVKVFSAGELVPALQSFDAVADGTADLYHGAEYYWQAKSSAFNFFTAVPMGMSATEITGWIDFGGGQQLWEELSGQFGVIAFQCANTGHQMGGWFRKEIQTLEDFKGLKMRIPGLGGDVIRELGGAAVTLAGSEIYQALQTGTIDATEWIGPWNDYALGFYREAPYYYGPGFHEPGSALSLGMNRQKWDDLNATEKAIIRTACNETTSLSFGEFTHYNALTLDILKREHGVKMRSFAPEAMKRIAEISLDIRAQAGSGDALTQKIYASFENALKTMRNWAVVSEGTYYSIRELGD